MKDTSARRPDHQGHRHPVEVGLRLPEGRGRGHRLPLHARPRAARDVRRGKPPPTDDYLLKVDNPLVVPVDKKIRIITTANDVIHAFMVPAFGIKQDAIPGFVRDTWFRAEKTGDYYGQCAELCGKEHAYMPIHVKVVSQADYTTWVDGKKKEMAAAADDPTKVWDARRPDRPRREGLRGQLRGLPPGQRQGRRPDQAARRLARSCSTPTRPSRSTCCSTARTTARCRRGSSCRDTEIAAVITYTKNNWSQQDRPARAAGRSRWPRASKPYPSNCQGISHECSPRPPRPRPRSRPRTITTTTHPHRLAALAVRDQPQGHRHDVPAVLVHHADGRRRAGAAASAPSCSSRACSSSTRSCSTS